MSMDDILTLYDAYNHKWAPFRDTMIGTFYIVLAIVLIVPYLICIFVMLTEKSLKSSPFFRIAIHIGVADVLQIIFNSMVGGIFTLNNYSNYWVNNTCAACLGFGWFTCLIAAHLMAFNRFVYVYWPEKVKSIFSNHQTLLFIALTWVFGLAWFVVLLLPDVNLMYDLETYSFIYLPNTWTYYVLIVHTTFNGINVAGMIVWYGLIYIKIRNQLKSMQNKEISKDKKKDMKILAQAVFLCSLVIFTIITFNIGQYVEMPWWCSFMTNILWLACAGSNSFVHIIINNTIRRRFRRLIFRRRLMPSSNDDLNSTDEREFEMNEKGGLKKKRNNGKFRVSTKRTLATTTVTRSTVPPPLLLQSVAPVNMN